MYFDELVRISSIPGKITFLKTRNAVYVNLEIDRKYLKERRYTIPVRTTIGKVASDDMMKPNENFRRQFPDYGFQDGESASLRSGCLRPGCWFLFSKLIKESGLDDCLRANFAGEDADFILDLIACSLICENNAGRHYPDYAYDHPLFSLGTKIPDDSQVSSFLGGITDGRMTGFMDSWNAGRDRDEKIYISYFAIDGNCRAGDVEIAESGAGYDGNPVFDYAIAYGADNRVPLYYEEYPGGVVDVSQLEYVLNKAKGYGYGNVGFILDRGRYSRSCMERMDERGCEFVMMVNGMSGLVSELVLSNRGTFEYSMAGEISECKTYGKTVRGFLHAGDERERYFHIYHSKARECSESEQLEAKLEAMRKYLKRNEGCRIAAGEEFKRYFDLELDRDGIALLRAREKESVVERERRLCGYFVIVTSNEMTAREALLLYRGRDESAKLSGNDKPCIDDQMPYVCSAESVLAKIFIGFLSLIIRNELYVRLHSAALKNNRKADCMMTVPEAIRELEKIEMCMQSDGVYRLSRALTAAQKAILRAFGLGEKFIKENAAALGKSQSK